MGFSAYTQAGEDKKIKVIKHHKVMGDGMRGMHKKHMKHKVMMHIMDKNKDGSISKEEFEDHRNEFFRAADKNRDGNLSEKDFEKLQKKMKEAHEKAREEIKAAHKKAMKKKHFDKLDADGDGKISKEEFDAKGMRKFIRMDHNDDGELNKADRHKKMKKRHMEKMLDRSSL